MWKNEELNHEIKYENVTDKSTDRSGIKSMIEKDSIEKELIEIKKIKIKENVANSSKKESEKNDLIIKDRAIISNAKPCILQNPQMHLYKHFDTYTVCPYCKYNGSLDIEYKKSNYQKKCCITLAISGLFLCSWIPLFIRSLSDQVYKCSNCKRELKLLAYDEIL